MMAVINTKNIHPSDTLPGHPYGEGFQYDEMIMTGAGEQGEALGETLIERLQRNAGVSFELEG